MRFSMLNCSCFKSHENWTIAACKQWDILAWNTENETNGRTSGCMGKVKLKRKSNQSNKDWEYEKSRATTERQRFAVSHLYIHRMCQNKWNNASTTEKPATSLPSLLVENAWTIVVNRMPSGAFFFFFQHRIVSSFWKYENTIAVESRTSRYRINLKAFSVLLRHLCDYLYEK